MWTYSRTDRLDDLIGRAREAHAYLTRERCDHRDHAARAVIDRRIATVQHRLRVLYAAARSARRLARAAATAV